MDHVPVVGVLQTKRRLADEVAGMRHRQWALLRDVPGQVGALDVAHCDVEPAVDLVEVVQRHHVRVIDCGGVAGLVHEPFAELRISAQRLTDDLERDGAAQPHVGGPVEHAHPTAADHAVDAVVAETTPGEVLWHATQPIRRLPRTQGS
jgi:hypothetical protein